MANVLIDESKMTNIANALRLKTGTTASFTVTQMPSVISNINTTFIPNLQNLEIYPSESSQAFSVASGYDGYGNITVYPVASDYIGAGVSRRSASDIAIGGPQVQVPRGYYSSAVSVAFPTAEHPAPTISFNSSTGVITATHSQSTGYTTGGATAASMALPSDYMPDPYYNIYKSLAFRSAINASDSHVSEWANSLSSIDYYEFAGQRFSGDFYFNSTGLINYYAFAYPFVGLNPPGYNTSMNFYFPIASVVYGAAFAYNSYIRSIELPECTNIGKSTFFSCYNLSYISIPKVSSIESNAFQYCTGLSSIEVLECTFLGNRAFTECRNLSYAIFPEVLSIGSYCFSLCNKLVSVSIPKVSDIGMYAFHQCYSLIEINIPECLNIGNSCFYSCSSLSSINLPNVQSIGSYAFTNCSSLSEINLPMISSLGNYTFSGCINLHTISLSGTISSIGTWTFANCSKLLSVYLNTSSVIGVNTNAFVFTPISDYTTATGGVYGTIYVPSSLYSSYLIATGWSVYSARLASF